MPTLHAVNVGLPKDVPWRGRTVHTGIFKTTVSGPVFAKRLNLDGDGQGDLHGHGGENRAVLVYRASLIRPCWSWPRPVMCRRGTRAAAVCVMCASRDSSPEAWRTRGSRWSY